MANSFNITSCNKTFKVFTNNQTASDYTYNKKSNVLFCKKKVNDINKSNLYINLITNLNLLDVPVIQNYTNNNIPTTINNTPNLIPYINYNIDPCGNLFGNTICGANNYLDYLVYNSNNTNINTDTNNI